MVFAKRWILAYVCVSFCMMLTTACAQVGSTDAGAASYRQRAVLGMQKLQAWYDPESGLYKTTGWWNSANAITTLADYSRATGDQQYVSVFANTFSAAQHTSAGFLNNFYDDEGWWALAWIDVYDLTLDGRYLKMADAIFEDMSKGWDDTCAGGIWWSKDRDYKNAIANELFLSVAAHLMARAQNTEQRAHYRDWALREWQWFSQSGMINSDHLVNDGLDAHCKNNHGITWSYNQGVILGGLAELHGQEQDAALLSEANAIAAATLSSPALTDAHGILHDSCEPNCGGDGTQFKGIFARNLADLHKVSPALRYKAFLIANADSIWNGMRVQEQGIGVAWAPPYGTVNASTQSSGEDALVAAIAVGAN